MNAISVLAEGLAHPEGPAALADGRIVFVETFREQVSAWSPGKPVARYALCGGGPNACCAGTDGVYVTQIGSHVGKWVSSRPQPPSIQRVGIDGETEIVLTEVGGEPLHAPNDLCFGPRGNLMFTDPGEVTPPEFPDEGFVYSVLPDGSLDFVIETGRSFPNGLAALRDGGVVWVESTSRLIRLREPDGTLRQIARVPEGHLPDGCKVGEDGKLYLASVMSGGVDVIDLRSGVIEFIPTGGQPLNCLFQGDGLLVADGGNAPMEGRLVRIEVPTHGIALYSGSVGKAEHAPVNDLSAER